MALLFIVGCAASVWAGYEWGRTAERNATKRRLEKLIGRVIRRIEEPERRLRVVRSSDTDDAA